jgi:uncharacterized protein (DUF1330 family)
MTLRLCVLLWVVEGREAELEAYEDTVLELVPRYGGQVVSRVRNDGSDGPREVQVIHLPDEEAMQRYLVDPERTALGDVHAAVIARTDVLRVTTLV